MLLSSNNFIPGVFEVDVELGSGHTIQSINHYNHLSIKIKEPINTFLMYKNNDSIRIMTASTPKGSIFKNVQIKSSSWTPKLSYYDKFFFIGTYEKVELGGIYFSFYATKD